MKAWTALVTWPNGDRELVDVDAKTERAAHERVLEVLAAEYMPGATVVGVEERRGGWTIVRIA